jgi:hypothetical protein
VSSTLAASGTVQFRDGAATLATVPLSGNSASMATSGLSAGVHPITAVYSGDDDVLGGTSNTVMQTVTSAPLTCPADPVAPGAKFETTVSGGSSKKDWIASFEVGAPDDRGNQFRYVPLPRPSVQTLIAPRVAGTYELRLYANGTTTRIGACTYRVADGPAVLAIGDGGTVTEGNSGTTNVTFTVTLTPAVGTTVTVAYATANGSAEAGTDFAASSGTLTFNPGETVKMVTVAVNGDTTPEIDENFFVNLSAPVGAAISDAQGQAAITNDDGPLPALTCPATVKPRAHFPVTVNGGSSKKDWVQSYAVGAPDKPARDFKYVPLPRPAQKTLQASATPGSYEVRLFADDGWVLLGTCSYQVAP